MDQQPVKTESATSVTTSLLGDERGVEAMEMETMLLGADDITNQSQTAQLFIEALLQTSRSQLLSDCNVSDMNQVWPNSQVNISHDSHMTDTSSQINISRDSHMRESNGQINISHGSHMTNTSGMKYSTGSSVVTTCTVRTASRPKTIDSSGMKRSGRDSAKMVSPQLPIPTGRDYAKMLSPQLPVPTGRDSTKMVSPQLSIPTGRDSAKMVSPQLRVPTGRDSAKMVSPQLPVTTGRDSAKMVSPQLLISSGRDSTKMISPQLPVPHITIKQSTSPVAATASPKKRSRRQTTGTMEVTDDKHGGDAASRRRGLERSVSESSSETTTTPRRKGSHHSDGGRRSRTHSESENDMLSDTVSMMNMYTSDDARRQMAGSITPETDVGFQPSMLDAVLTEKKLALLRSPEVRQFLQQQQIQKAKERKLTHTSPTVGYKGDNS